MTSQPLDPTEATTLLVIDVQYQPEGPVYHWWLAAAPPFGTHPDPLNAWEALQRVAAREDPFESRADVIAAQIWSGPERATVHGFWDGRWVRAEFNRINSAATSRWEELRPFLQPDL